METDQQRVTASSHGCAYHARYGRPGGIGQPARLELSTSDPEEVVQPWADAMQTLPRSLVQDWEMLPGMRSMIRNKKDERFILGVYDQLLH